MQYLVRLTDRAERDTKSIYEYVERTSIESAFAWFSDLEEAVYSLERYSERGRFIPENKKLRQLLFGEKPTVYRIIYAVDKHRLVVNIVHIRHVRIPLCANFVHRDTAAFRCNRILGSAQNIGHRTSMTDGEGGEHPQAYFCQEAGRVASSRSETEKSGSSSGVRANTTTIEKVCG